METFVPAIQENLRRNYPLHKSAELRQIVFGPELKTSVRKRWLFLTKDSRTAVSVSSNSVVLETTEYDTFDAFVERIAEALEIVSRTAAVTVADRLGLRYVDVIRPAPGEELNVYLQQPLHGFTPSSLQVSEIFQRHEYLCTTPAGALSIRVSQTVDGNILPPGLDPDDLEPRFRVSSGEKMTILDIDHASEAQRDFAVDAIVDDLWTLHDHCDIAFRAATTESARTSKWLAEKVAV